MAGESPASRAVILVADDNAEVRALVAHVLGRGGWEVVTAGDGLAAWDALRARRPAVAVLDADMPLLSGLELARRVRTSPGLRDTRVLVITAHAHAEAVVLAAGADRYLAKPCSPTALLDAVRALLVPAPPADPPR